MPDKYGVKVGAVYSIGSNNTEYVVETTENNDGVAHAWLVRYDVDEEELVWKYMTCQDVYCNVGVDFVRRVASGEVTENVPSLPNGYTTGYAGGELELVRCNECLGQYGAE